MNMFKWMFDKTRILIGELDVYQMASNAASQGYLDILKYAYSLKHDSINEHPKGTSRSSLYHAISNNKKECMVFLFERNPKLYDDQLSTAIRALNVPIVEKLLKAGLDPNKPGDYQRTAAATLATRVCNANIPSLVAEPAMECLALLKNYGLDINIPANRGGLRTLGQIITPQSYFVHQKFIDAFINDIKDDNVITNFLDEDGHTMAGEAQPLKIKSHDLLLALLKKVETAELKRFLYKFAESGAVEAVCYVIEREHLDAEDLSKGDKEIIKQAILMAAGHGNTETLDRLLPLNKSQKMLNEALGSAVVNGNDVVVDYLLNKKADPDYGYCCMHPQDKGPMKFLSGPVMLLAADYPKVVASLANAGANPNILDEAQTPLISKLIKGMRGNEAIRALILADADLEALDAEGFKPIYWASKSNNVKVMRMLLAAGVEYDSGASLKRARNEFRTEMIELLEKYQRGEVPTRQEAGLESFWEQRMAASAAELGHSTDTGVRFE